MLAESTIRLMSRDQLQSSFINAVSVLLYCCLHTFIHNSFVSSMNNSTNTVNNYVANCLVHLEDIWIARPCPKEETMDERREGGCD